MIELAMELIDLTGDRRLTYFQVNISVWPFSEEYQPSAHYTFGLRFKKKHVKYLYWSQNKKRPKVAFLQSFLTYKRFNFSFSAVIFG